MNRVAVLTTSYPRHEGDAAGRFVADAVERLRARGLAVDVVSPASFRHFGIAYGAGIAGNLRARPERAVLVPSFLAEYARAARRTAAGADVVHAHWLVSGLAGIATGKPLVLQVWGTDVELARRVPWLARPLLRRAAVVVAASRALAAETESLGGREVRVIPSGVDLPAAVGEEAEPPELLYAGRLSAEKGVLELVEAARGLNLVVAGDGPLRDRVPGALGMLPHAELEQRLARAAVVVCPSRREGFGVVCAEAMAHGRPVVATDVGGLRDLVVDGETGLVVPPRDPVALRAALERLLGDPELRRRLGAAGRERVRDRFSWAAATDATLAAYEDAVG